MIRRLILLITAALALSSASAHASRLHDKVPAQLDPSKAYVVVEIGRMDGAMLFGTLTLGRYDTERMDIAIATPRPSGKLPRGGWKLDNRLFLNEPAIKEKDRRFYIAELDPGLWVIEGANDTAFSLGSQTMELAAGSITDLGVVSVYTDFPDGEKRDVLTTGRLMRGALMGGLFGSVVPKAMPRAIDFRSRVVADMLLPPVFAAAQPATWSREVQFGNYLGGLVNRMGGRKSRPNGPIAPSQMETGAAAATPETSAPEGQPGL